MASEAIAVEGLSSEGDSGCWQIWIDTGGTFTDCLAVGPRGAIRRAKVLSSGQVRGVVAASPDASTVQVRSDWELPDGFFRGTQVRPLGTHGAGSRVADFRAVDRSLLLDQPTDLSWQPGLALEVDSGVEAPVLATHWVTRTPLEDPLPPITMRLATTRGTNAMLERTGSSTALFISRGFGDLLAIGTQQRPDLFSLAVEKRQPLYEVVVEVRERMCSNGEVLEALDLESARSSALELLERGVAVAAVALMNSYRDPRHEEELADMLTELGFRHVSRSAALAPLVKIVPRAETAVVNAYLSDVIGTYLAAVRRPVSPGPLHVLTSAGSLVRSSDYLPKDSLLSGPAGGVVGAAAMATESGFRRSIAFDMGGTSTDVSRFDGELDYRFETQVGDARLLSPSLAIETVAAGGGSVCSFDGRQLKVGPESAGATPGPACYGAGGPLTLTDVNLLLGRLDPLSFEIPIKIEAAEAAARRLAGAVEQVRGIATDLDQLLHGLLEIANERMSEAVRRISIRQGYRVSDYALVAFGGAGGQHACALAEVLGISTVLVPEDAGLLSAVGLGRAQIERFSERQVLRPLQQMTAELPLMMTELEADAESKVLGEGVAAEEIVTRRRLVLLRLQGQEASLALDYGDKQPIDREFARVYEDHYGYRPEGAAIEVESIRVIAASRDRSAAVALGSVEPRPVEVETWRQVLLDGQWQEVPVFEREALVPGSVFSGPALVFESHCATVVGGRWRGEIDRNRCLVLTRDRESDQ